MSGCRSSMATLSKLSRLQHDTAPPQGWPEGVCYFNKPRLSANFPPQAVPLITPGKFAPRPIQHPPHVIIKTVNKPGHPAHGQRCLVAKKRIGPNELIIPYLGVLHLSFTDDEGNRIALAGVPAADEHDSSDYDISLLRLSSADSKNPYGVHLGIGVDAAKAGNAARFVNDFRGIGEAPNAEFRLGKGEGGEARMEVWSGKNGVAKGAEVLVSYGKSWWGARK